jgi:hypothetical protein
MAQFKDGHRVNVFRDPDGNQLGSQSRMGTITGISEDASLCCSTRFLDKSSVTYGPSNGMKA